MRAYIETVTRDTAPDERADPPLPARLSSAAGAVLGIAVALLIALLPGGAATGSQLQSAFSASTAEQGVLAVADRAGEARRALPGARGPNARRPDFDNGLIPVAASAALAPAAPAAASPRFVLVRAQRPGRWFSSAQARAPPRA
jgi:hypothetical protein